MACCLLFPLCSLSAAMSFPRVLVVLSLLLLSLCGSCEGTLAEFDQLDVSSPSFDVDAALSAEQRWARLRSAASVPLKGWNSYDGWDWAVTESDIVHNIDYVAANLSSFGYNIVTIESPLIHSLIPRNEPRRRTAANEQPTL